MKLYNTASREIEDFVPSNPNQVKIYTCGPTVYSYAHIGNLTAYVYWDLLVRTLQIGGWSVDRVLNMTDVGHLTSDADDGDDKMEKGAKREGKTVWEVADMYIKDFMKNFHALNLVEPTKICRATDYIKEDLKLVEKLDKNGYLYDTTDGLYYDTSKFADYAKFARLDLEHLKAGARVEFNAEKRNPSDFAVWKWIRDGEDHAMKWEFRGRMGYPGWHLECATIIHEELGEPIDIHTGGIDHIPVHHTNEIAEMVGAYGSEMARFWLHNNFINIEGEKISKSLGNVYTFSDLAEKGFSHLDFKMWVLQGHYQSERNFSFDDLAAAKQRLLNYRNYAALRWQKEATDMSEVRGAMIGHLENNLNSAGALAELDIAMSKNVPDEEFVGFLDKAFGLKLLDSTPDIDDELKQKIAERLEAKKAKDYKKADALRDEILEKGITLLDGAEGSIWQYVK